MLKLKSLKGKKMISSQTHKNIKWLKNSKK